MLKASSMYLFQILDKLAKVNKRNTDYYLCHATSLPGPKNLATQDTWKRINCGRKTKFKTLEDICSVNLVVPCRVVNRAGLFGSGSGLTLMKVSRLFRARFNACK